MENHPVQLRVTRPARLNRLHVLIRLAFLLALGALGYSSLYWVLYLGAPAAVALLLTRKGDARYLGEDAPRIIKVLRWLAAGYGYLWMLTDAAPAADQHPVDLVVQPTGAPTPVSALLRLIYSLPALLLVALLSVATGVLWLVGAAFVLATERLPELFAALFALTLRVQLRLVAYHLSLVDRYPSLDESPVAESGGSHASSSPSG